MTPLLFVSVLATPPVLAAADGNLDVGSLLAAYGTAAPFAALCLWWVYQARKDRDSAQAEAVAARAETKQVRDESLARERELTSRVAPMLYDGARLYERGNSMLPASLAQVDDLTRMVHELVEKMGEK